MDLTAQLQALLDRDGVRRCIERLARGEDRRVLEEDGRPRLIHTVHGVGYVLRDP